MIRSWIVLAALLLLVVLVSCARARRSGGDEPVNGPDARYWRYDDIVARLEDWAGRRPDILRLETIGHSHAGEPIRAVKLARDPDSRKARPALVLHAAQHANEANGTGALMRLLERLLAADGRDPRVTAMIDGLEIWFVPVVNVDGYRRVFAGEPGWEEWRKNGRDNDGDGRVTDVDGVDLNRNWDHRWSEDPSVDPASRNYRGPHPFSEPETRAIRDLILREMPVLVLDLHSPGKITPPNVIFWPWLLRETGELGPDATTYRDVAQDLARRTETEVDGVFYDEGPSYDRLPKEQCWIYRETGICILLMEVSTRFWWEGPIVDEIADRVATGCLALLDRALDGPGLAGRVVDAATGEPLRAEVRIDAVHDDGIGPRRTEGRLGAFWRFLPPGEVVVTITADGYAPVKRRVGIGESGWTTIEVRL